MDKYLKKSSSNPSLVSKRPREETSPDQWRKPKKFLAKQQYLAKDVPINNRFNPLDVDEPDTESFLIATKKKTVNNTPPIVIEIGGEWTHQKVRDTLLKYVKDYHMKYSGRKIVRVQCYNPKSHQQLKEGLLKENVAFHTFTRKDEKLPKAVIKGLPKFLHNTISDELTTLGFPGAKVSEIKTLHSSECPPVLVQLPSGTNMSRFKQIKYLSNCSINVERYKITKKQGTQCFRCQGFGHASRNCNLPPRCVKCAENHPTWECTKKDRETPAQCCNCQQAHPANFTHCSERLKYINRIDSRRETLRKTLAADIARTKLNTQNTWAHIAARKPTGRDQRQESKQPSLQIVDTARPESKDITHEWTEKNTAFQVKPINKRQARTDSHTNASTLNPHDYETMEMLEILETIQTIKHEFTKCKTFMDKVILIITHFGHYV